MQGAQVVSDVAAYIEHLGATFGSCCFMRRRRRCRVSFCGGGVQGRQDERERRVVFDLGDEEDEQAGAGVGTALPEF